VHIFYSETIQSDTIRLSEEESKHAVKVLRLKIGDQVQVFNGKGVWCKARLISENHKLCELQVIERVENYHALNYHLHIAIAPTKNIERFEWFLEKATEIGISEITPILTEHSERKVIKNERLEKVILSAAKQSQKAFLPKLNELSTFTQVMELNVEMQKYIAHCHWQDLPLLKEKLIFPTNALILIGPEGDFSISEVEKAKAVGFQEISLGNSRLRTETAGIVACHSVALLNG